VLLHRTLSLDVFHVSGKSCHLLAYQRSLRSVRLDLEEICAVTCITGFDLANVAVLMVIVKISVGQCHNVKAFVDHKHFFIKSA